MSMDGAQSGSEMLNQHSFSASNQPAFGPGKRRHGGSMRTLCPHCSSPAYIRSSRVITRTFKELRLQCSNIEGDDPCGFAFVASLTIDRTLVPSMRPRAGVNVPMNMPRIERLPSGQPAPANDAS